MPSKEADKTFDMTEPRRIGLNTEFAFWLTTANERFLDAVARLGCIASVQEPEDGRSLIEINDDFDPDEAWHWTRTEIEYEVNYVELDPIWEEALKWVL